MAERLHLKPKHRRILVALLRKHLPGVEVWAYGSRVSGKSHDGSDLDLVLRGPELAEIPSGQLGDFEEAVRESNIPFLLEARDWTRLPERFHREIERDYVVLVKEEDLPATIKTLGDYFTIQRGTTYKSRLLGQDGPVLLGLASIHRNGGFRSDSLRTYGGDCPDKLLVYPGQIYVSLKDVTQSADLLGATARLPADHPPGRLTQDTVRLDAKSYDVRLDYIHWLLRTSEYRGYCRAHATGTTNLGLPRDDFLAYPVPALNSMRCRIVDMLNTIDDKIELNRHTNETLEAMARALFKSWFVDFDPVRAKMAGRDPGLPRHLADLFPDRLVDSELGEIPEGWASYRLDEMAEHHTLSITPTKYLEEEFEHFSIPAYDSGRMPIIAKGESIKSNKTLVPLNAVLLSKLNPEIARVWIPGTSSGRTQICSTEFLAFTPRYPSNRSLLFVLFTDTNFRDILRSMVTGTSKSHQRVPPTALKRREVICGTPDIFSTFGELAAPTVDRTLENHNQIETLTQARDTLLPKLISGELRTNDISLSTEMAK